MEEYGRQLSALKQEVLNTAKKAYREKLMAGTSGNMSVFVAGAGSRMVITPGS